MEMENLEKTRTGKKGEKMEIRRWVKKLNDCDDDCSCVPASPDDA